MKSSSADDSWSGEMLDRPEMVEAFSAQVRSSIAEHAHYIARIRRDAEAMWKANPPDEYGPVEARLRHRKVAAPFAKIQEHLEEVARLTFQLSAQYRRQRHEVPARKAAAAEAKREAAQLSRGTATPRRLNSGGGQPYPKPRPVAPAAESAKPADFLGLLRDKSA